jgi:hypothetical protein
MPIMYSALASVPPQAILVEVAGLVQPFSQLLILSKFRGQVIGSNAICILFN